MGLGGQIWGHVSVQGGRCVPGGADMGAREGPGGQMCAWGCRYGTWGANIGHRGHVGGWGRTGAETPPHFLAPPPMEGELIGHSVGHGLRVGSRARAAAEDAMMDSCQFVRHAVGHVGAAGEEPPSSWRRHHGNHAAVVMVMSPW